MDRKLHLSRDEIARPFNGELGKQSPVILSPKQLAQLLGKSVKTVYGWMAAGHLDGCYRRRGKHCLIWRDRALDILLNGEDWTNKNGK